MKKPPIEIRLRVLTAVDYAPGNSIRERIKHVSEQSFTDQQTGQSYQFTWRTISTWFYRFKNHGMTSIDKKTRSDKHSHRKVQAAELAEAINDILPRLSKNKTGLFVKSALYTKLIKQGYFQRSQLSQTSFYRMIRTHELLKEDVVKKFRLSFAMQFSNELWQADTMYGPSIKQIDGTWKKTFLIAFIDDASRLISHGEFFFADDTKNMIEAFRSALYKRGIPERLYFDNGSNYSSKEILQACLRLEIKLSHAPVRDGAAKGKIERFFRGFRDRFLTQHISFNSLSELNQLSHDWIENDYNSAYHSGIQMIPMDRFKLDIKRVKFLLDDEFSEEVFFIEEDRKVSKTNVFSINSQKYECPVDLREKKIQVRFNRRVRDRFIVFFQDKRMGDATLLNLHYNAQLKYEVQQ